MGLFMGLYPIPQLSFDNKKRGRIMEDKKMKITVKPTYKYKMDSEELQNRLKMKRTGASRTQNGRAYNRKKTQNKKWGY